MDILSTVAASEQLLKDMIALTRGAMDVPREISWAIDRLRADEMLLKHLLNFFGQHKEAFPQALNTDVATFQRLFRDLENHLREGCENVWRTLNEQNSTVIGAKWIAFGDQVRRIQGELFEWVLRLLVMLSFLPEELKRQLTPLSTSNSSPQADLERIFLETIESQNRMQRLAKSLRAREWEDPSGMEILHNTRIADRRSDAHSGKRTRACLDGTKDVILEGKYVPSGDYEATRVVASRLSSVLREVKFQSMHLLRAQGVLVDDVGENDRHISIVYEIPSTTHSLIPLLDLLRGPQPDTSGRSGRQKERHLHVRALYQALSTYLLIPYVLLISLYQIVLISRDTL